ncbi:hypothetical protein B0H67DRAFT_649253 [Lasiosphaeris hirsuta]|uniref:Uncharacterized protein n=1 Tax=Lasiosphaeris hirsuta TaxID=260670 RepID=A0AA39ZWA2_9PEZI|nr:hypothetical protein B0H67DRAFT_649253 [Lasiosphaeris hirsuta]
MASLGLGHGSPGCWEDTESTETYELIPETREFASQQDADEAQPVGELHRHHEDDDGRLALTHIELHGVIALAGQAHHGRRDALLSRADKGVVVSLEQQPREMYKVPGLVAHVEGLPDQLPVVIGGTNEKLGPLQGRQGSGVVDQVSPPRIRQPMSVPPRKLLE